MKFRVLLAAASLLLASSAHAAEPFTPEQRTAVVEIVRDALRRDPGILRDAIAAMQEDDQHRADAATRGAILAAHDSLFDPADPVAGNPRGDVTIVEFFDTRCGYCRKLEPTMEALLKADPGVRLIYKDLPILGPASVLGSRALLASQAQGPAAYVRLRAAVMAPGTTQTADGIVDAATQLGLDAAKLRRDMDDPAIAERLKRNVALSEKLGIQGTPGMVIGTKLIPGVVELTELTRAVAEARAGG